MSSAASAEYKRVTGLGNKLFPWSRARILSRETGCTMLAPRWFSPRSGAITRGGIEYRYAVSKIWLAGNFRADPADASHLSGFLRYANLPQCFVNDLPEARGLYREGQHYIFRWDKCHTFSDLKDHRKTLLAQLEAIARPSQSRFARRFDPIDFIALNIRTGKDFVSKSSGRNGYFFTEVDWFAKALSEARKLYGNMPAFVISDGGQRQLQEILKLPEVELVQSPTAIADLLILAKSKVLLGSGNSSFSAWASFLGGMDTYSSPDTPFDHFDIADGSGKQVVSTL